MVALERVRELWELNHDDRIRLVGVVVTQSLSTFPAIACIINELEILNSVLRRLGISCALVGDMISQFLFGSTIWVARIYRKSAKAALIDLATMTASVAVVVFAIRPTMLWTVCPLQTILGLAIPDVQPLGLALSTAVVVTVVMLAEFVARLIPPLICRVAKRDAFALALIITNKCIVVLTSYTLANANANKKV
ncbi:hypothetical protein ACOSQ2_012973 [Xanthoceras sorbifolium]